MVGTPEWMQRRMRLWRHRGYRSVSGAEYAAMPLGRNALRALRKGLRAIRFGRVPRLGEFVDIRNVLQRIGERSPDF